jgi:hypothetical protein
MYATLFTDGGIDYPSGFHWTPYEPVDDITRFTEGDCHILARAIHRHTGWAFCTFEFRGGPDAHAFVRRSDGYYVDVQGVATEAEMLRRWYHTKIRTWTMRELIEHWPNWAGTYSTFGLYSYLRADQLARKIAAW